MSNYRLKIQYDGTRYHGWQRQKTGADTIQGRMEQILSRIFQEPVEIDGAGRTDAGVHAKEQVANFHIRQEPDIQVLFGKLNEYLPEDIRILEVERAGERFHSRLNATGKIYEYHLLKKNCFDVFTRKYSWQMTKELDIRRMRQGAALLCGSHDFRGFCTKASKKKSTVRRVDRIEIRETEKDIFLRYEGNGFLYNMVRIITGTLVEIGAGEKEVSLISRILAEGDRTLAGETAPARGLVLQKVKYD